MICHICVLVINSHVFVSCLSRPCLTWRDVQSLIVYTVLPIDFLDAQWVENRAGFNHSHLHGFGLLDAYRLTMAAKARVIRKCPC